MLSDLCSLEKVADNARESARRYVLAWIPSEESFPIIFSLDKKEIYGNHYRAVSPNKDKQIFIITEEIEGGYDNSGNDMLNGELVEFGDVLILHPSVFERLPKHLNFEYLGTRDIKFYNYDTNKPYVEKWDTIEVLQ